MPELPEVEGTRRRLLPLVAGRRIERLKIHDFKLWHPAEGLTAESVEGRTIRALDRRAKILIFSLEGDLSLLLHLKIAGQIAFRQATGDRFVGGHPHPLPDVTLPERSTRFSISLADGSAIFINDQRRFSWLRLLSDAAAEAFIAGHKYGPDPLEPSFTPEVLAERLRARKGRPIKAALLDQTCVAGLGNIYADESLHAARLHPMLRAGDASPSQVAALHRGIVEVLAIAVPVGGAIVNNGRAVMDADSGRDFLRAHGRAGQPCPDCGEGQIVRAFLAGRGTYFCPVCQQAPPGFALPVSEGDRTDAVGEGE
jgi:formamidopyrimidine-DNA glycosylase